MESGFGPLGTSCLLSTSPAAAGAEFHLRGRGRKLLDLARARRPPAGTGNGNDDAAAAAGSLAVPPSGGGACSGTTTSTMPQRKADVKSSSNSSGAGALHLSAHRALAMQESIRRPYFSRILRATPTADAHEHQNSNAASQNYHYLLNKRVDELS